jgi:hypothetical protein
MQDKSTEPKITSIEWERERSVREVLAKLTSEERDGGEKAVWLYEEHVELLVDLSFPKIRSGRIRKFPASPTKFRARSKNSLAGHRRLCLTEGNEQLSWLITLRVTVDLVE